MFRLSDWTRKRSAKTSGTSFSVYSKRKRSSSSHSRVHAHHSRRNSSPVGTVGSSTFTRPSCPNTRAWTLMKLASLPATQKAAATVHIVCQELDSGEVLGQVEVAVLSGDTPQTLAERVLSPSISSIRAVLSDYAARPFDAGWIECAGRRPGPETAGSGPEDEPRLARLVGRRREGQALRDHRRPPSWRGSRGPAGESQRSGRDDRC